MDSPTRDGKMDFDTRFSTPVSELDDHRLQEPIPPAGHEAIQRRASMAHPPQTSPIAAVIIDPATPAATADTPAGFSTIDRRRGTAASANPPPITFLTPPREAYERPIARDFTEVLTDDEGNEVYGPFGSRSPRRHRSRRSTGAHYDHDRLDIDADTVAVTSRSSSPPNSVDAFAEPRRRERANTADSRAPPDFSCYERSISGITRSRRPTFNNGSVRDLPVDDSSPPEDDVCFPQETEPTKCFTVDFEAIEEFVAESERKRNKTCARRHSFTSSGKNYPGHAYQPDELQKAPAGGEVLQEIPSYKTDSGNTLGASSGEFDEKVMVVDPDRRGSVAEDQRFSFFSSEIEQTIHVSNIGDLTMPGETFRDLFDLPDENGAWWLDVMNPTEDEIDMFQKAFGIHRLTAEDIEKQETREKVELFKQYYFVSFRSFVMDHEHENYLDPVMSYMVVFRDGILSFSYASNPHASHVRQRIGKLRNYINLTADWICYALVDDIVDCFAPFINEVERESDQIEDQVFTLRAEDSIPLLRNIGECRKKVTSLMRLLGGKADVIKGFTKRCNEQYSMAPRHEIGLYLGDIQDHVVTMMSNLAAFEKILSRSHANYLAHLSVDSLMQGNKANDVLSKITIVATILVPMNLITGLFGMNVPVPGKDTESLAWFLGIMGFMIFCVLVGLGIAKKARYI